MAKLVQRGNQYLVRFRCGKFCPPKFRSCLTNDKKEAERILHRIGDVCHQIKLGLVSIPPDVDPGDFIFSGGKRTSPILQREKYLLTSAVEDYFAGMPTGAKDDETLKLERLHCRHFARLLPKNKPFLEFDFDTVQGYINTRRKEQSKRGRPIHRNTIVKEINSLRQIWKAALKRGKIGKPFPKELMWPKDPAKPSFQSYAELTNDPNADWSTLVLKKAQVLQVLNEVAAQEKNSFIYPVLAFAAFTGCRRSELVRVGVSDVDFELKRIRIHEKKRRSSQFSESTRYVTIFPRFEQVLKEWIEKRPSSKSPHLFLSVKGKPLTRDTIHRQLAAALKGTSFPNIRGFHVFRHSFITNLAIEGATDSVIDKLVGHTTNETRMRYRHLLSEHTDSLLDGVFGGDALCPVVGEANQLVL